VHRHGEERASHQTPAESQVREPIQFTHTEYSFLLVCCCSSLKYHIVAVSPVRNNYKEYSMESRTQFRVHAALIKLKADTNDQDEITSL